jgi:hypothetical protein
MPRTDQQRVPAGIIDKLFTLALSRPFLVAFIFVLLFVFLLARLQIKRATG